MSLNQSMNIALGSIRNHQYALSVVSQNIANLNVENYHKQRVNFATNEYTSDCDSVLSTIRGMNGASISSLSNYIDNGKFKNLLNSKSDADYYNTLANQLSGLEDISDDLGEGGLNALLNEFFKASGALEQMPSDISTREQFVNAAQNVVDKFGDISAKYDKIKDNSIEEAKTATDNVNKLLEELVEINKAHIKNGGTTTTQAQINTILEELSTYIPITTDTNQNGSVNLYINGINVVEGAKQRYSLDLKVDKDDINNTISFGLKSIENPDYIITKGVTESLTKGSLKGYVDFLNGENSSFSNVNSLKASLNSAANAFCTELNKIQNYDDGKSFAASITTDNDDNLILEKATTPFIDTIDGTNDFRADNIKINDDILSNPYKVSAARINLDDFNGSDWTKAIGNSDNAIEFSALQNKNICSVGDGVNNATLSQFLIHSASKSGGDLNKINSKAKTYNDIYQTDANNYANLIGVNLDEELSDMIRYQRAFEASARVFTTVNDLMGTILSMV